MDAADSGPHREGPISNRFACGIVQPKEMSTPGTGVPCLATGRSFSPSNRLEVGTSGSLCSAVPPPAPYITAQPSEPHNSCSSPRASPPAVPSEQAQAKKLAEGGAGAGPRSSDPASSDTCPQQQHQQHKERNYCRLANRLAVPIRTTGFASRPLRRYVDLHAALDLLQLPLDVVHLPLLDLPALLSEVPDEDLILIPPSPIEGGSQRSAVDAPTSSDAGTPETEDSPASSAAVRQRQQAEECARRELVYAAKRFQRQRRLLLQQIRNRLHAAMQQIYDLQDAKGAAEIFLEELRHEVAATRTRRQKAREAQTAGQQQQQDDHGSRLYFDPLPPPSSQPLPRYPTQQQARVASEEETSDTGESFVGYEGSASVERLMQRYYATLVADVDQAAREHARAQSSGVLNGEENLGGQEGPLDGGAWGGALAPYYFDPFSPDQGIDASRRWLQGTGAAGHPSTAAPAAGAGGSSGALNGQGTAALAARSHPMLSAAAEKVRGVAFCKSNRYWICTRMEHGKQQCRYFSVKHLGFECARREAILLRQQWKGDVNEEVLKALEEEKAAMDAAAGAPGGSGVPARSRGVGEVHSPSVRPTAPPTPSAASPSKTPHVGIDTDAAPPPRKDKTGPIKRRRDALTRPLVIDRSGTMPRPPPEFDFASDSDFLTDNEEDREEEALAMNAAVLAEFSDRNARAAHSAEEGNTPEDDPEALLKRRRREIVANCFMGVTSTADALVLLSRRLTYAVKIPGISFHKGVESWLCTWKEPDSRTISRYFRCSRFGFRRGFKLSVFTLLLNAPRAAGMRAFMAIKEIKRRRRAALRGDLYNAHEPSVERPLSCEASESLDRAQSFSSTLELRRGADMPVGAAGEGTPSANSAVLARDPEAPATQHATPAVDQRIGTIEQASSSGESLTGVGTQLIVFGTATAAESEFGVSDQAAAAASTGQSVRDAIAKPPENSDLSIARGGIHLLHPSGAHKVAGAGLGGADVLKCDASTTVTLSPRAEGNQRDTLGGNGIATAHFGTI